VACEWFEFNGEAGEVAFCGDQSARNLVKGGKRRLAVIGAAQRVVDARTDALQPVHNAWLLFVKSFR